MICSDNARYIKHRICRLCEAGNKEENRESRITSKMKPKKHKKQLLELQYWLLLVSWGSRKRRTKEYNKSRCQYCRGCGYNHFEKNR